MSLLMDALKKAEKEKKQSGDEADVHDTTLGDDQDSSHTITQEQAEINDAQSELSLEPLTEPAVLEDSFPEDAADDEIELTETVGFSSVPLLDNSLLEGFDETRAENTLTQTSTTEGVENDSTLPSERTIKASVDEYFDASQSIQSTMQTGDETYTSVTLADTGLADGTQINAQTVFAAGKDSRSSGGVIKWLAIVSLVLMLSLGLAYFYYYAQTPSSISITSPMVARSVDSTSIKPPVILPPLPSETNTSTSMASTSSIPEQGAIAMTEDITIVQHPEATFFPAPRVSGVPMVDEKPVIEELAAEPVGNAEMTASVEMEPVIEMAPVPALMTAADRHALLPSQLQITKSKKKPQINKYLQQAYSAYTAGHLDQSRNLYQKVIDEKGDQRDALLGLAAIAMQNGDRRSAAMKYRTVLNLNPRDSVASAALFNLNGGNATAPVSESHLKMLLDQNPASSPVHFSLGSLYARQSRWSDAQQSFFEAWRGNKDNADYAFNLAVSLDHLHQHKPALEYYQRALDGSDNQNVSFNTAQVMGRIQALTKQ